LRKPATAAWRASPEADRLLKVKTLSDLYFFSVCRSRVGVVVRVCSFENGEFALLDFGTRWEDNYVNVVGVIKQCLGFEPVF
jgi:hypothetical protein